VTALTADYLPIGSPISGRYSKPNAPPDRNIREPRTSSSITGVVIDPARPRPRRFDVSYEAPRRVETSSSTNLSLRNTIGVSSIDPRIKKPGRKLFLSS
jgi:hypothetical protein